MKQFKEKNGNQGNGKPRQKKEKIKALFPLTPMQEGLLYIWLLDKKSAAYFIQIEVSCQGIIDHKILEKSFNILIERHVILRTVFIYDKIKKPLQIVLDKQKGKIDFYDISHLSGDEKTIYLKKFKQEDREKGFDLAKDILMRFFLFKTGEKMYKILWSFHHILMDRWSSGIFLKDLLRVYLTLQAGQPVTLEPPIPFSNYIKWINQQDRQVGLNYWEKYLEGCDRPSILPGAEKPPSLKNAHKVEEYYFKIDETLTANLQEIARMNRVTMNVLTQVIWAILLMKYNNTDDVVFGAVVSGRDIGIEKVDQLVGMFANTIPIRVKTMPGMDFSRLLQQTGEQFRQSQSYEYLPLAEIQSLTPLKNQLINHLMAFENYNLQQEIDKVKTESERLFKLEITDVYQQGNYDFYIIIVPDDCLLVKFIYNSFAYSEAYMERIASHFKEVGKQISWNHHIQLAELEIMDEQEKEKVIKFSEGPGLHQPIDTTIHQLFEKKAAEIPGGTALVYDGTTLTYGELNGKANQLARYLKEKGIGAGSIVGVIFNRSFEMVIAILAILKAGAAYLPIDTEFPPKRILQILNTSGCSLLLTSENVINHIPFTQLAKIGDSFVMPAQTPTRPQITDYDSLPFPDRTLIDYRKYHRYIGVAPAKHTICIHATRGCPYNCAYCHKIWPKKHVVRSAENIFQEVKMYYDVGIRRFVFIDDIFNLKENNSRRFLERLLREKMNIQLYFSNGLRGDILSKEFINLMIEAGTVDITLALETASPRLQKLLRKNLDLEKFEENIDYIIEKYPHVILELEMMLGFPSETEEEAMMTLDFLKRRKWVHFPDLHVLKVYPNTDMYRLAVENGVSREAIERSRNLAYHELPDTLPFSKAFARQYQADFLNEYFLSRERLAQVLPSQMKILTKDEMVQKYDSYLPVEIRSFQDITQLAGLREEDFDSVKAMHDSQVAVPDFNERIQNIQPKQEKNTDALRIFMVDLSQWFTEDSKHTLYNVVAEPMGLMSLMTYLDETFAPRIQGKIVKSRLDFDNYLELKSILMEFKPDLIGIRALTYYKEFFHKTISLIRQWGIDVPIVCGGPYATSDYGFVLQDANIDLVVIGEGEYTLREIVEKMLQNGNQLPNEKVLQGIRGISYIKEADKSFLKENNRQVVFIDHIFQELTRYGPENPENKNTSEDLLYFISTSGSTGTPKSVMLVHRNLINLINYELLETNIDFGNVLQFASIGFDVSAQEIFSTLLAGGKLILIPNNLRFDIAQLLDYIAKNQIKTLFLPPVFLKYIFSDPEVSAKFPPSVKHIVCAGEALIIPENLRNYLKENGVYIHNHYGPSETHVVTSLTIDPSGSIPQEPSIGRPISNTQIFILDRNRQMQPLNVAGELCIAGTNVGKGYYKNDALTREHFIEIPLYSKGKIYCTKDLARWLPDGNIEFLGRIDNQVKIRGFRVELAEIEVVLRQVEFIKETVVIDRHDQKGENYLCAYIVADKKIDHSELKEILSETLPDYMLPSYFIQLETIPLTVNRKIDRNLLPPPDIESRETRVQPRNKVEEKLLDLWAEILEIDKQTLDIDGNFFELGGHSLKATILISKLHKEFEIKIPLMELFQTPTVRKLGEYIAINSGKDFIIPEDVHLALLKKVSSQSPHLFFIHDGTGDIDGYMEFCHHLKSDFNCWGIRAKRVENYSPHNIRVEDLANRYIRTIKKVQPHGPFHIAGWCIGGTIAFETALQLEQLGEQFGFLVFFDSIAPHRELRRYFNEFTVESELQWVKEYLPVEEIKEKVKGVSELEQFWDRLVEYLEEKNCDIETLKKLIPVRMAQRIPNINQLKIKELIPYLNRIRTLLNCCALYIPSSKLNTPVQFFRASKSETENKVYWNEYCSKPVTFYEIKGDHFSILKEPGAISLANKFDELMARTSNHRLSGGIQ